MHIQNLKYVTLLRQISDNFEYLENMEILVISLPQARERRDRMTSLLAEFPFHYEFVDGVLGEDIRAKDTDIFRSPDVLNMSKPEIGCLLAHIRAWQTAAACAGKVLILEDDVHFSSDFSNILWELDSVEISGKIVKLETMHGLVKVVTSSLFNIGRYSFHRMRSPHFGAAAYVIDSSTAKQLLLLVPDIKLVVDLELFGDSRIGSHFDRLQVIPGCVIQDQLQPITQRFGLGSSIRELNTRPNSRFSFKSNVKSILSSGQIVAIKNFLLRIYSLLMLPRGQRMVFVDFANNKTNR